MVVSSRRNVGIFLKSFIGQIGYQRILDLSSSLDVIHSVDRSFSGFAAPHFSSRCNWPTSPEPTYTKVLHIPYRHHEAASTGLPSASPGVSDCFSPGATTAATASFRRLEVATTSNTSAIPARHPARRLANSAHSCGPNTRAVARLTRKVCAGCASLPVSRPTRIAVDKSKIKKNQS